VNYLAFVKGKPSPDARLVNSQIGVVELRLTQFLMPMLYPEISKIFRPQFQLPGNLCPDSSHADYDKRSAASSRHDFASGLVLAFNDADDDAPGDEGAIYGYVLGGRTGLYQRNL